MSDHEIDKIATQLQHLAPAAWATTTHVVQVGAVAYLGSTGAAFVVILAIGLVLLGVGIHTARKRDQIAKERGTEDHYYNDPDPSNWFIGAASCGVVLIIPMCALLFAPWAWISAFHPDLGTAHQILGHIGIQ